MRRSRLCPGTGDCASAQIEQPQLSEHEAGPCMECPLEKLNEYLASPCGRAIQWVVDLDFALERRMTVGLGQITWIEFQLLRILAEERNRWQNEEIERSQKKR